jgi:hypothetical protein
LWSRELDERLGFGELIEQHVTDPRRGSNTQFPLADLFRQSAYSRLADYEDVNDTGQLSQYPSFRPIGSNKIQERGAALTSRLQSFGTEMLAEDENFAGLPRINRELTGRVEAVDSSQRVVPQMDSTEIPAYGQQEESAYDGHCESTCWHGWSRRGPADQARAVLLTPAGGGHLIGTSRALRRRAQGVASTFLRRRR